MKLTKTASGKTTLSITRTEWEAIGAKQKWIQAGGRQPGDPDFVDQELYERLKERPGESEQAREPGRPKPQKRRPRPEAEEKERTEEEKAEIKREMSWLTRPKNPTGGSAAKLNKAADGHPVEVDALIRAASECGHRFDPDTLTRLWQQDPKLVAEMYAAFKGMAAGRADTELKDEQARQERVKEDKAMGVKGTPWITTPEELQEEGYNAKA